MTFLEERFAQIRLNTKYVSLAAARCIEGRVSYKKVQVGKAPRKPLTLDQHIDQFDRSGFEWVRGIPNTSTKGRRKRKQY